MSCVVVLRTLMGRCCTGLERPVRRWSQSGRSAVAAALEPAEPVAGCSVLAGRRTLERSVVASVVLLEQQVRCTVQDFDSAVQGSVHRREPVAESEQLAAGLLVQRYSAGSGPVPDDVPGW